MANTTKDMGKDMGKEVMQTMQDKSAQPENDRRAIMQNVYDTSMQSVQSGIENDIWNKGSLTEKREFMANVMSANLYGKQLATKDNPVMIPDIEVDDRTEKVSLTMSEYRQPEVTYEIGSSKGLSNSVALTESTSSQEKDVRNSMKDVHSYVDAKQEGKGNEFVTTAQKDKVKDVATTATLVGGAAGIGAKAGAIFGVPGMAVGGVAGAVMGAYGKKSLVESRVSTPEKAVSQAISADKRSSRLAQAEALVSNVKTESNEVEYE